MKFKSMALDFEDDTGHVRIYIDSDGEVTKVDTDGELYPEDLGEAFTKTIKLWQAITSVEL